MTRQKSTTFKGASPFAVDVDELTLLRALRDVAGDLALIFDKATGEHGEANTINHGGAAGRGSLLGVPTGQYVGRSLAVTNPTSGDGSVGATWIVAVPFLIEPGETEKIVEVVGKGFTGCNPVAYFLEDSALGLIGSGRVNLTKAGETAGGDDVLRGRISGLTTQRCTFYVEIDTSLAAFERSTAFFTSWRVWPGRQRRGAGSQLQRQEDNPFGVTAPLLASEGVAAFDFNASWFTSKAAYHGRLTAFLQRQINGLLEYGTARPAGGNADYTHEDKNALGVADSSDPAHSQFFAHTRTQYTSEPEPAWPLCTLSFGARKVNADMVVDAAEPPTQGMLSWAPPSVKTGVLATNVDLVKAPLVLPDFDTGSSKLKWAILATTKSKGNITRWTGRMSAGGATATDVFGLLAGSELAIAEGSALAFNPDQPSQLMTVGASVVTAHAAKSDLQLLGATLYFQP